MHSKLKVKMAKSFWRIVLIVTLILVYLFCLILHKQDNFGKTVNKVEEIEGEELQCEKVWKNVIQSRQKSFSSRINPAHMVVDELLEIVSENKTSFENINSFNSSSVRFLVVLVNSARSNFYERQLIRETWGSLKTYSGKWEIRTVFLLGQSKHCLNGEGDNQNWLVKKSEKWNETKLEELKVESEQKEYGDLVIGSFTDTYRNLTYKHLMGYKFVLKRCPQVDFIVKTDDDVFVNIPRVLGTRLEEKGKSGPDDMICYKHSSPPNRSKKGEGRKWLLTENEWPTDKLPEYCIGEMIGLTRKLVENIFRVRNFGGFLWIDDAFVTGMLREIAEKEFEVKTKMLVIKEPKLVWYYVERTFCNDVTTTNLEEKRRNLPIYAAFSRDTDFEWSMKCLYDISVGRNLSVNV